MISANDLRNVKLTKTEKGYSIEEVNATLNAAATTIDAYVNENKELYRKMELLAARIEEYREEEDSIKSALITAQKMADQISRESSETAKKTVDDANDQASKIVSEARDYANSIVSQKTDEANALTAEAEKKANDAINSSKIVAQNILDQAKEISDDLISKSKEEKEAYESLNASLRANTQEFIATVSSLYLRQLELLKDAQLGAAANDEKEVNSIQKEVDTLVGEIDEMEGAIPENVTIEPLSTVEEEPTSDDEEVPADDEDDAFEELTDEDMKEAVEQFSQEQEEPQDPMKAVEAFSQNGMTPIETDSITVPEITEDAPVEGDEEKSLFDEPKPNFEKYFHVNKEDAHGDRTQTISLVPPEDYDEEDEEPKFKGFFGKKK